MEWLIYSVKRNDFIDCIECIDCLEKYFDMNKKQCREALDIYKKFLDRTDKVSNFLKVAEVRTRLFDDLENPGIILD